MGAHKSKPDRTPTFPPQRPEGVSFCLLGMHGDGSRSLIRRFALDLPPTEYNPNGIGFMRRMVWVPYYYQGSGLPDLDTDPSEPSCDKRPVTVSWEPIPWVRAERKASVNPKDHYDGVLLVFDVTRRETFEALGRIWETYCPRTETHVSRSRLSEDEEDSGGKGSIWEAKAKRLSGIRQGGRKKSVWVAATKADTPETDWTVSREEAQKFSNSIGAEGVIETSAKTGKGADLNIVVEMAKRTLDLRLLGSI